jgi:rhamnopyranosyl-N-acetylglucosaminyl-diphospho-decaprenol beta-1,3/1,4-galactofuranosyltransferase
MKIAAIVATFNRLDALKVTVMRLLDEAVDHVVIVDNASSDGTGAWLFQQDDPRLAIVSLNDNTGGAGGFEAGMAYARAQFDPDWVVMMDDDAHPQVGALETFRTEAAEIDPNKATVGAAIAAVFYPGGKICEMNRPSKNPFWNPRLFGKTILGGGRAGFHIKDADYEPDAGKKPIDIASFVGYFISRAGMAKTGLPEGGLFIYGDDVLYSLRLRRAGVGMVFMPAVRFDHDCGTIGKGFIYRPLWKIYYHCRNGVSIARQVAGPIIFPAALGYYTLLWWRLGRHYEVDERHLYRKMMWAGLRDGIMKRRGRNDAIHTLSNKV